MPNSKRAVKSVLVSTGRVAARCGYVSVTTASRRAPASESPRRRAPSGGTRRSRTLREAARSRVLSWPSGPSADAAPGYPEPDERSTYLGHVHGTRAALDHMLARDHGAIVQVGSALAYRGIPPPKRLPWRQARHPGLHRVGALRAAARQVLRPRDDGPDARLQHPPVLLASQPPAPARPTGAPYLPAGGRGPRRAAGRRPSAASRVLGGCVHRADPARHRPEARGILSRPQGCYDGRARAGQPDRGCECVGYQAHDAVRGHCPSRRGRTSLR